MNQLLVGFGREAITPAGAVHMAGYGYRNHPSIGIRDDLYVSAVALSDGTRTVLLMALDIVSLDLEGDAELKGAVRQATGLPVEGIITNTSHTHAGPMVVRRAYQPFEPAYFGAMLMHSARAASQALATMAPASLSVGEAPVDIGVNRRHRSRDGSVTLSVNPEGLTLPEVTVWYFERAGAESVVLWSAPIHGVVMHETNLLISSEWMGAAVRELESAQPGMKAVFLQGCCGDQNPYRELNNFTQVDAIGSTAAEAVRAALRGARKVQALPLVLRQRQVVIPLDQSKLPPEPPLIPDGPRPPRPSRVSQELPLRGLRLGDALLVGMAGEPFVEYAIFGRQRSPARSILMLGYTDSTINYLPTAQAYQEGGYEPGAWIWYPDGNPWMPDIEPLLKEAIADMITELWSAQP